MAGPPAPPRPRLAYAVTLLALFAYLALSAPALDALGVPYGTVGGSYLFKLHPGSYLLTLALLLSLLEQGNPLTVLGRRLRAQPPLAVYLACMVLCFAYTLWRFGTSGSAYFIDTLLMPAFLGLLAWRFDPAQRRGCFRLVLGMVLINGAIGIAEAIVQRHLIPYVTSGVPVIEDMFRATALLGHPLENALVTSIVLLASLDLPLTAARRFVLCGFLLLALLAFGGRTSFLLSLLSLAAYGGFAALRGVLRGRYGYLRIVGSLLALMLALPAAIGAVWATGLGTRIFESLYLDDSVQVRFHIYEVFHYVDASELLFGMPAADIDAISFRMGLVAGQGAIENFWLYLLMQLGAFVFAAFVIGLFAAMGLLWRSAGAGGRLTVLVFLLTASTSNSLSSKTSVLVLLFALIYGLGGFPRTAAVPRPAGGRRAAPVFGAVGARP